MSWGKPETARERIVTTLLQPASSFYGVGAYLRLRAYGAGLIKRHKAAVPVVSVGSLTCGGTGKTPITIDLARRLIGSGRNVAIVSRGYKRKSGEELLVVSDGAGNIASCEAAGDEPYMMAQAVPQAKVIVSAKRSVAADIATRVYDCDIILLDDGFQHLSIERNEDIVLIDYNDDPAADSLLPAGRLREPISALTRADWVVITKVPENPNAARLSYLEELVKDRAQRAQVTRCRFVPHVVRTFGSDSALEPARALAGVKVLAVSGIARPRSFVDMLSGLQAEVVKSRSFGDHHWWCKSDIDQLRKDLKRTGALFVVTTEKDAARLSPELCENLPVRVVELKTEWLGPVPLADLSEPVTPRTAPRQGVTSR